MQPGDCSSQSHVFQPGFEHSWLKTLGNLSRATLKVHGICKSLTSSSKEIVLKKIHPLQPKLLTEKSRKALLGHLPFLQKQVLGLDETFARAGAEEQGSPTQRSA